MIRNLYGFLMIESIMINKSVNIRINKDVLSVQNNRGSITISINERGEYLIEYEDEWKESTKDVSEVVNMIRMFNGKLNGWGEQS